MFLVIVIVIVVVVVVVVNTESYYKLSEISLESPLRFLNEMRTCIGQEPYSFMSILTKLYGRGWRGDSYISDMESVQAMPLHATHVLVKLCQAIQGTRAPLPFQSRGPACNQHSG